MAGTGENLGTAYLALSVDTTGFDAAVARAKNITDGLGSAAAEAMNKADTNAKRAGASLIRWADLIGKTAEEQKFLNALMRGVPLDVVEAVRKKYNETQVAIAAAANSARDLAAAESARAQRQAGQEKFIEGLIAQQREYGKTKIELLSMQAAELGIERQAAPYIASLNARAEAAKRVADANQLLAQGENFVKSLQQQALAIDKTRSELLALKAAELGVTEQAAPFIAALKKQEAALTTSGIAFNQYGLSVKQTQAALRQVPAQLTDIFVGLQGGQNPLTVLIQQGGQLKDVFGGIKPAAQALGGAIAGLVNPYTVAAAAAVGLALAVSDAQSRAAALSNALLLTGNSARLTTADLQEMASVIDGSTASSERNAQAVIAQVAATGKFTADQIQLVATAAIQMEEATGKAVKSTVAEFATLKGDPISAIVALSDAVGDGTNVVGFLTPEIRKSVEELQRQGDTAGATEIAVRAYFDAINDRAPAAVENLSNIARWWKVIKSASGDALDFMVEDINTSLGQLETLYNANQRLGNAILGNGFNTNAQLEANAKPKPKARPVATSTEPAVTKEQQRAIEQFRAAELKYLSDAEKRTRDLAEATKVGTEARILDTEQFKKQIANINKYYDDMAEQKAKRGKGSGRSLANAELKSDLQYFKDILTEEQAAIKSGTLILQAEYNARTVDVEDYYAGLKEFSERGARAEEAAITGQIAALKARSVAGKDAVDDLRKIGELEAELAKSRAEHATQQILLGIQEKKYYRDRDESIQSYIDNLNEANIALQIATNSVIRKIGVGQQEFAQQERVNQVYEEQAARLRDLKRALDNGMDYKQYAAEVAGLQAATDTAVNIITQGYQDMLAAQGDWLNGVHEGVADWMAATADVASQISQITTRTLDSAADAFTEFATTGKANVKGMLADILTEITKFFAKRAIMQFLMAFFPGLGSTAASPAATAGAPASGFIFPNANGNSFAGGTTLPTNSVVSQPTMFKFAKGGAFGLAGEAGPEAIMPLKRGADGKLGVTMNGGGAGSPVMIHVETNIASDGSAQTDVTAQGEKVALYKEFSDQMRRVASDELQMQMRPGGSLYRAGVKAG